MWSSAGNWSRLSLWVRRTGISRTCSSGSSWSQICRPWGLGWGSLRLNSASWESSISALTYTPSSRESRSSRFVDCVSVFSVTILEQEKYSIFGFYITDLNLWDKILIYLHLEVVTTSLAVDPSWHTLGLVQVQFVSSNLAPLVYFTCRAQKSLSFYSVSHTHTLTL